MLDPRRPPTSALTGAPSITSFSLTRRRLPGSEKCNFLCDEHIIGIAPEGERQRQRRSPRGLGSGDATITKKVIVDLTQITNMHSEKGCRLFNQGFEDLGPWLVTQVGNHRAGIKTVSRGYAFHRRSSLTFSSCLRWANASLLVRVVR